MFSVRSMTLSPKCCGPYQTIVQTEGFKRLIQNAENITYSYSNGSRHALYGQSSCQLATFYLDIAQM